MNPNPSFSHTFTMLFYFFMLATRSVKSKDISPLPFSLMQKPNTLQPSRARPSSTLYVAREKDGVRLGGSVDAAFALEWRWVWRIGAAIDGCIAIATAVSKFGSG